MSRENLVKLMQAAAVDEQLTAKLQNARSYEEVKNVAQEKGFELGDLSAKQAQRTMGVVTGQITDELTDEELAMVAAGYVDLSPQVGDGFSSPGANDSWHLRATH